MKKYFLISLLIISLISCQKASNADNNNKENLSKTEKKQIYNITFSTWAGGEELKEMQDIAEKVNQNSEQNGYKIDILSIPDKYYTKIQANFAAKSDKIDLMWISQEYIPRFAALGGLVDMTDSVDISNMYDGAKSSASYEGKVYGIPWIVNPVMVYYNKNLTDAAGYTEEDYKKWENGEWDIDEFKKVAISMSKDTDGDGKLDQWGTYIWDWPPIIQWIWTFGGSYIDDSNNITITNKETIEGFKFFASMFADDASALPSQGSSNNGLTSFFQTGKVGMILAGSSDGIEKEGMSFDIGYGVMPKGRDGSSHTFPWIGETAIPIYSDVPKDILITAAKAMSEEFFKWKVASPVKGQEALYQELLPKKKNLSIGVMKKSLEIAKTGNLFKYAEIGQSLWNGTDGKNGIKQILFNATNSENYKEALNNLDFEKMTKDTADAIKLAMED